MPDSETTRDQKRKVFTEVQDWVKYLQIHGLEGITLSELRRAYRALDTTDVRSALMKPAEARPRVLKMYRLFRQEGHTPPIAMQMVRNSLIGLAEQHPRSEIDLDLSSAVMAEAAMGAYVAGRYLKTIEKNTRTARISSYWDLGFISANLTLRGLTLRGGSADDGSSARGHRTTGWRMFGPYSHF